jgi:cyclopropane fatty-acyl-phospholipid synthase-like methyltransferase
MGRHLAADPTVAVPAVFDDLSTRDVLVTQFVDGVHPYDTDRLPLDPLTLARRIDDLIDNMIYFTGLCHADLHPGNFFWSREGQIVLIDLGLVHQLSKDERNHLLTFYTAVIDGFHAFAADYFLRHFITTRNEASHGIPPEAFTQLDELVRKHWAESGGQPSFSAMFSDLLKLLMRHRLRLTHDYSRLFLTLVTMEGYLYSLDPGFDMLENARRKRVEQAEYASVSDAAHDLVFGPGASYSTGRFSDGEADAERAYAERNALVLDALGVGPGSFLLDIGCGRGQLLAAARDRGVRALGVTISRAEHESCLAKGLDCVHTSWEEFDRRGGQTGDRADAIAVIEMDNHLATLHENRVGLLDLRLSRFFAWARDHLRDDGRLFLQSLTVPDALLHDPAWKDDYDRLTDVAPLLGFSTLPQLVRCSDPYFAVEQVLDHSSDLLPTYEFWRGNTNRSLPELRQLVGDDVLVYLRRQLDTLIWLTERRRLRLYRLVLTAKSR